MSRRKKAVEVLEGTPLSEANTYIKRLAEDADLREAVGRALESSRAVFDRVSNTKKISKLYEDSKLQAEATAAIEALRAATSSLADAAPIPQRKRKRGSLGKKLLLVGAGGVAALVASEGLRSKVLDALFGAEEEFEYSPPPPSPTDTPGSPLSAV